MLDTRDRQTTRVAGAACLAAAVVIFVVSAVFRLTYTANVVGVVLGAALLVCGVGWLMSKEKPRVLPTATTATGMALVVGLPFLTRRGGDDMAVAWITHIVVGLVIASVGVWAGKRLRIPRIDHL